MKIILLILISSTFTQAKVIQLLHTNDLHSFFEGTRTGLGGYARLKTKLQELRKSAAAQGIPTLHLDGGDFGEGSSFFFSDKGVDSLRALDLLGVDVTVIGNHDYMLGGKELARQINRAQLKAQVLSANLANKRLLGLRGLVKNTQDFFFDGVKVRIVGLSTPEIHYQYPLMPLSLMRSSHDVGIKQATKKLRDGVDVMIALTHTGIKSDRRLVQNSRSYDLIIGGHDHFRFEKPVIEKNLEGREIPIFQAGAHSIAVGQIFLEINPGQPPRLISYELHEIDRGIQEETRLRQFVDQAKVKRENYFGRRWDEVIGYSEFPLHGSVNGRRMEGASCWSKHLAKLTREAVGSQYSFQLDNFQGEAIPAGPLRFGDLIDNFPHFRRWDDGGWGIVKATIPGFALREIIRISRSKTVGLTVDGNLDAVHPLGFYSIALPSEVTRAISRTVPIFSHLLLVRVKKPAAKQYWRVLEDYIRKNSPLTCELL